MIGIINYGMGNLASVKNALNYLNIKSKIIGRPAEFKEVDQLILPGVGAFGKAMENLDSLGLTTQIKEEVLVKQKPILGICLGMQLLLSKSFEFGEHKGLNLIEGEVLNFKAVIDNLPIPHIGWNDVEKTKNNKLLENVEPDLNTFYFVHTFYCKLKDQSEVVGYTDYGIQFNSMLEHEWIFGSQFHPEKSQKSGLEIFKSFHSL